MLIKNKIKIRILFILVASFLLFIVMNIDYSINNRKYLNDFNQKNKFSIELIKKDEEFSYFKMIDRCVLLPLDERTPKLQGFGSGFYNLNEYNNEVVKVSYFDKKRDEKGALIRELKIKNNLKSHKIILEIPYPFLKW